MTSRRAGSRCLARLAGSSTWAITCPARARGSCSPRRGWSPGRNTAVAGRAGSQPCWRTAVRNALSHADEVGSFPVAADRGVQVGEVVLDDGAVDAAGAGDAAGIQEHREPGQGPQRPGPACAGFQAGGQPPPDPSFGQVFQLRLRDAGEVQDAPGAVSETVHLPGVAAVLGVPAGALGQVRDLRRGTRSAGRPPASAACRDWSRHSCRSGPAAMRRRWRPGTARRP